MLSTTSVLPAVLNMLKSLLAFPAALFGIIKRWLHYRKCINRFPGPPRLPLLGNLLDAGFPIRGNRIIIHGLTKTFPNYVVGRWDLGPFATIVLNDPRDIQVYLQNPKNQRKALMLYDIVGDALGRGLVTENDEVWRRHHKIIQPAFHTDNLSSKMDTFCRRSEEYVAILEKHADGRPFDLQMRTEQLTMDIVYETQFGSNSSFMKENETTVFQYINRSQEIVNHRLFHPWFYPRIIFQMFSEGRELTKLKKIAYDMLEKALQQREKILDEEEAASDFQRYDKGAWKRRCAMDAMVVGNRKGVLSREEVLEEALTFKLAGFDTSYVTILMSLYHVANNPDIQKKLVSEIRTILEEDCLAELTVEKVNRMKYLEMVMFETLRMHAPVWILGRYTGADTPLVSNPDLVVPEGAMVLIPAQIVHMNPETYPNPEVFDPERFSPENTAKRNPFAFLSFSKGARACIGRKYAILEVKTILANVLNKFEIKPDPTYAPEFEWGITGVLKNGMRVKLYKR